MKKEAMLYRPLEGGKVECFLCGHRCLIHHSRTGVCRVRRNEGGRLYSELYGEIIAAHVDPIEKKPLYHFLPGSRSFSIATAGCNFRCPFCQNWQISQVEQAQGLHMESRTESPQNIVRAAKMYGCQSISYTYTEPTVFFEFAYDTALLAAKEGLGNVFVTNGYMSREALETIRPYLDACNVDLKAFSETFYKEMCGARLEPVLDSIRLMKELGIWVEITTLIIPGQNDGDEELGRLAGFIAGIDPAIPWHVSRFHPDYKYTRSGATPVQALRRAYRIGKEKGLHHIYIGNVLGESEDTVCSRCGKVLIRRHGFGLGDISLEGSHCPACGHDVAGVFSLPTE